MFTAVQVIKSQSVDNLARICILYTGLRRPVYASGAAAGCHSASHLCPALLYYRSTVSGTYEMAFASEQRLHIVHVYAATTIASYYEMCLSVRPSVCPVGDRNARTENHRNFKIGENILPLHA